MTDNNETLRALLGEMAAWRKDDANRQRQIDLLFEAVKDLTLAHQKLYGSLAALQSAVELIVDTMAARRN
jgi:hypothetical protein